MTIPRPHGPPTRRRRGSIRVGSGTVRETAFGTFLAYVRPNGIRKRRCFDSFAAAERWIQQESASAELPALTAGQYADAQTALSLLPACVSLVDAARDFVRVHANSASAAVRLEDAVQAYLDDRASVIRSETLRGYRVAMRRLVESLGPVLLSSITADQIDPIVASSNGSTRNERIKQVSSFCSWCIKRGMLVSNPCERISRARNPEMPLGVFSVSEAERILRSAQERHVSAVAYLAVGLFSGIRPAELLRLSPNAFGSEFIRLDGRVTKIARARVVSIRPNLREWLDRYPWRKPSETTVESAHEAASDVGVGWPRDGMRHSFATYAYEMTKDAAAVAAEMGHQGTAVFFKHYRALAEPGDGAEYFAIRP